MLNTYILQPATMKINFLISILGLYTASVVGAICVRSPRDCPQGTTAENEPDIVRIDLPSLLYSTC
jgi:hypothetical protein